MLPDPPANLGLTMTKSRPAAKKMWAVLRSNEIYLIVPTRRRARHEMDYYGLNGFSKHKWIVEPVNVTRVATVGEEPKGRDNVV